jgi:hypothetical protein
MEDLFLDLPLPSGERIEVRVVLFLPGSTSL